MTQILHGIDQNHRPERDWSAYNIAASREREFFKQMVGYLIQSVDEPPYSGRGRPPLSLRKTIADLFHKVHDGRPSRQAMSDLSDSDSEGIRDHHVPHFNSLTKYLRDKRLTPILYSMLIMTSHPMRNLETVAAVDSSGFIARPPGHWNEVKHGRDNESKDVRAKRRRKLRRGRKVHLVSGVQSNIIMAATITSVNNSDHNEFVGLLDQTLAYFRIKEMLGDAAYMSRKHYEMLGDLGIIPFIDFRSDVRPPMLDGSMWSKMFHLYSYHQEVWKKHYHQRSNVETTFSMVKGHWGEIVLERNPTGQTNEILFKLVAHNIWVLNHQSALFGIDPLDFGVKLKPSPVRPTNGTNGANGSNTNGARTALEMPELVDLPFHSLTADERPTYLCFCDDCMAQGNNSPFPYSQN